MIGIIGAMEQEIAFLKQEMIDQTTETLGGFTFYLGNLMDQEVVLLQCGIGKVNAALGCCLMIANYNPQAIINTGSAGGLLDSQEVGDLVVSSGVVYHDVDVTAFGYKPGQIPRLPAQFSADQELIELAEGAMDNLDGLRYTRGMIGSGDSFIHDPSLIQNIKDTFHGLCAVEMEGAAIAHTCYLFQIPWVVIRALSDIAGKESPMVFSDFLPLASQNSSAIIVQMLKAWKKATPVEG